MDCSYQSAELYTNFINRQTHFVFDGPKFYGINDVMYICADLYVGIDSEFEITRKAIRFNR